jgi:DNA-binding NtrC family response regulator
MLRDRTSTQNFILHGLDRALAMQLCDAVALPGRSFHSTKSASECLSVAENRHADMVFCSSDRGEYEGVLRALEQRGISLPVVVVSRIPETSEWLDALDAGAADYCAAPFERPHISWLVESALLAAQRALAVA